jgi:hypothetical protein
MLKRQSSKRRSCLICRLPVSDIAAEIHLLYLLRHPPPLPSKLGELLLGLWIKRALREALAFLGFGEISFPARFHFH